MSTLTAAAQANLANENNLEYWVGYRPTPEDLVLLQEKIDELEKTRLLIEPVGSFRPVMSADGIGVYDLGGNVAEWVTSEDGRGKIKGLSAVSPHSKLGDYSRPPLSYVGFRVIELN